MAKLDENYFNVDTSTNTHNTVESFLVGSEKILWRARPKRSAYVWGKSISMMPIALVWGAIDFSILFFIFSSSPPPQILFFIIPFFALHLAPVWIWLGAVIKAVKNQKTIQYIITNKRIIEFRGNPVYINCSIEFKDLDDAHLKIGIIDKILKVGDIKIMSVNGTVIEMCDIKNPAVLHSKILAIQHMPVGQSITQEPAQQTQSQVKKEKYNECEYCGVRVKNTDLKCPNCGAINYIEEE